MGDPRQRVHVLMRGLVKRFGKQEVAAKEMADYWHPTGQAETWDTADLSRKMSGSRRWTYDDILALQALTGSTSVTEAMCEEADRNEAPRMSSLQHASRIIKENAEAVTELMDGKCPERQRRELIEAREVIDAALRDLPPVTPMRKQGAGA